LGYNNFDHEKEISNSLLRKIYANFLGVEKPKTFGKKRKKRYPLFLC